MAPRRVAIGSVVSGKYRLIQRLGGGGMGEVYRAEHQLAGRIVALKLLRSDFAEDEELTRRFFQEAQAVNKIRHPNIVDVLDAGFSDEGPYVAMECLEGASLSTALHRVGKLDTPTALSVVLPMLDALDAAHRHGIVHRDLKPENVFLAGSGEKDARVKILDFGIAKVTDTSGGPSPRTHTGVIFGTPDYLSPEQASGDGLIDGRSDIFAVGIVLFELLTGRRPFESKSAVATAYRIVHEKAPTLAAMGVECGVLLQTAIDIALAKRQEERFSTALAFSDMLAPLVPDGTARREALRSLLVRTMAANAAEDAARAQAEKASEAGTSGGGAPGVGGARSSPAPSPAGDERAGGAFARTEEPPADSRAADEGARLHPVAAPIPADDVGSAPTEFGVRPQVAATLLSSDFGRREPREGAAPSSTSGIADREPTGERAVPERIAPLGDRPDSWPRTPVASPASGAAGAGNAGASKRPASWPREPVDPRRPVSPTSGPSAATPNNPHAASPSPPRAPPAASSAPLPSGLDFTRSPAREPLSPPATTMPSSNDVTRPATVVSPFAEPRSAGRSLPMGASPRAPAPPTTAFQRPSQFALEAQRPPAPTPPGTRGLAAPPGSGETTRSTTGARPRTVPRQPPPGPGEWSPRALPVHVRGRCHARGSLPRAVCRWIDRAFGAAARTEMLDSLPPAWAEPYRSDGYNALVWYDLEATDAFIEAATVYLMGGDTGRWRDLARDNFEQDLAPILRPARSTDPAMLLKRAGAGWTRLFDFGSTRVSDGTASGDIVRTVARVDGFDGASLAMRYLVVGTMEATAKSGGAPGVVGRVLVGESSFARDFEYEVLWQKY